MGSRAASEARHSYLLWNELHDGFCSSRRLSTSTWSDGGFPTLTTAGSKLFIFPSPVVSQPIMDERRVRGKGKTEWHVNSLTPIG